MTPEHFGVWYCNLFYQYQRVFCFFFLNLVLPKRHSREKDQYISFSFLLPPNVLGWTDLLLHSHRMILGPCFYYWSETEKQKTLDRIADVTSNSIRYSVSHITFIFEPSHFFITIWITQMSFLFCLVVKVFLLKLYSTFLFWKIICTYLDLDIS